MKLQDILSKYLNHAELEAFAAELKASEGEKYAVSGMVASQVAFVLATLFRHDSRNTVVILNDKEEALYFFNDLQALMPKKEILFFPASYKKPYQIEEIDNANVLQRAEVLNQLNHTQSGRQLIVTFSEALSEKIINKRSLVKNTLDIRQGDELGMDFVVEVLEEYGFEREEFVYEPGQYAMRGGILDVFSFANELPYRIEFFGQEVDSIRIFEPVDQRSEGEVRSVSLIPNIQRHLTQEEKVSFFEYISSKALIYTQSADFVKQDLSRAFQKAGEFYKELAEKSGEGVVSSDPSRALPEWRSVCERT